MAFTLRKKSFRFPISSQVGSSFDNIIKISSDKNIDQPYKGKFFLTKAVSSILELPRLVEEKRYNARINNLQIKYPPIFIIGFWRSGTTVLHNLLCQNPDFGYVNTFQAVFPNHCFMNQGWIRNIAQFLLPEKRPGGDMKFDFDMPQEEEIALGNMQPISFYNFFYYPNDIEKVISKSLFFNEVSKKELDQWKQTYLRLVKIALLNSKGERFVSKNPPNTFRIPLLLEMFPDAKFIYLHRDKYQSVFSFQKFVNSVHDGIKYQDYDIVKHNVKLIHLYKMMLEQYEKDKNHILNGNLVEVRFEDFEMDMPGEIERIYTELKLPDYEKAKPRIEKYYNEISGYERKQHKLPKTFIRQVDEILNGGLDPKDNYSGVYY